MEINVRVDPSDIMVTLFQHYQRNVGISLVDIVTIPSSAYYIMSFAIRHWYVAKL